LSSLISLTQEIRRSARQLKKYFDSGRLDNELEAKFRNLQNVVGAYLMGIFSGVGFLAYSVFNLRRSFGIVDVTHSKYSAMIVVAVSVVYACIAFILLLERGSINFRYKVMIAMCYFATMSISLTNLVRPDVRADGDVIAFVSSLLIVAFLARFNHRTCILWLLISVAVFYLVKSVLYYYGSGEYGILSKGGIVSFDRAKVNIQVAIAAVFAYAMARINESRDRQLFMREHRLAQSAEERLHLLQAIGHDLRQPMTAISLHCDLARNAFVTKNSEAFTRSIDVVQKNVSAVNLELTELTELAAVAENSEDASVPVSVGAILQRLYASYSPRSNQAGVDLYISLPNDVSSQYAFSNEAVLSRVFGNILNNALKFTELKDAAQLRAVSIDFAFNETTLKVSISDTGIGIAEEHLTSIWAPFFQVDNPERNRERGFGLGLAHVQASLNQLTGHTIALKSTLGVGTTFEISLPRANAVDIPTLQPVVPPRHIADHALEGSLIMIVEDDAVLREAISDGLQLAGARTVSAATIASASSVLTALEVEPDLVMIDYRLPDGTGRDFMETVIEKLGTRANGGPALVCLSGEHISALKLDGIEGLKLIRKPIDLPSLVESLRQHLNLNT
jgi:signal transduction histidine kinase